jgi:signal peptidase II
MGQGLTVGFAALSFLAAAFIVWWLFFAGAARDWLLTVALALVTAGICGNLYDRLGFPRLLWDSSAGWDFVGQPVYAVRDWLDFRLIHWPIFNIADSLLVVGATLLFWHVWVMREGLPRNAAKRPADESTQSIA